MTLSVLLLLSLETIRPIDMVMTCNLVVKRKEGRVEN
jgi:hypothetical protein